MITEKEIGCDNCYYSYFDEKAYPCSLCIRGIERTDKWQPNRKTKEGSHDEALECVATMIKARNEAQTKIKVEPTWEGLTYGRFEDEPQTETEAD